MFQLREDEATGGRLQRTADDDGDVLAHERGGVVDDDHGAVGQVTDGLVGVLAFLDEHQFDLVARHDGRPHGLGQAVEIEHGDALKGGDAAEVGVVGEQAGALAAGEPDQLHVDGAGLGLVILEDFDFGKRMSAQVFEALEAAPAALAFDRVLGVGEQVEFIEHEPRHDERGLEEAGLADGGQAAVDEDVGVDQQALLLDAFLAKTDVRDEQGEFLAVRAQRERDAEKAEGAINDDLKDLLALALGFAVARPETAGVRSGRCG